MLLTALLAFMGGAVLGGLFVWALTRPIVSELDYDARVAQLRRTRTDIFTVQQRGCPGYIQGHLCEECRWADMEALVDYRKAVA